MAGFIIMIVIIVVCILLFGNADSKRTVLKEVGLDLSEKNYENQKEKEFEKYCKKAMKLAITDYNVYGTSELSFLYDLGSTLDYACDGLNFEHPDDYNKKPSLQVSKHYIRFASKVVYRRVKALEKAEAPILLRNCDYSAKGDLKKYIDALWNKYQYPWPKDWKQNDGII